MARFSPSSYGRRRYRTRMWIYAVGTLLIIVVAVAFFKVYIYPRFASEGKADTDNQPVTGNQTPPLEVVEPYPEPEPELLEVATEPTSQPNPRVTELIAEAMALINATPARIIDARDVLNEALPMLMSRRQWELIKDKLSELSDKWLFSNTIFPADKLCESYRVNPGDLLSNIGKQYKVPHEILMQINGIDRAESLQAGHVIKVINGPFHARVYRSTFTLDLYLQNTFVKSFPVGLGQPDNRTPVGLWLVKSGGKLISPTWTDPATGKTYQAQDPDYPLGSRWIGLQGLEGDARGRTGFGIHGTKDPDQIGTASSLGCIRLHNGDVILVYNLVMPGYSRVEVVE